MNRSFAILSFLAIAAVMVSATRPSAEAADEAYVWKVGLAREDITPQKPIWMAGYASRKKPSEGVLAPIYAKALAIEDRDGNQAVLITADVISYSRAVSDLIVQRITKSTGLERRQILLNPSHTHSGPVLGVPGAVGYGLEGKEADRVVEYTEELATTLGKIAATALKNLQPATLSYGVGVVNFVMNRREFTDRGVRLGVNPSGYADRSVPVLTVTSTEGNDLRAIVFGCACHNTTLGGDNYQICGDYAGWAQEHVESAMPGVQAMFMIGCGADANPYPRGQIEHAKQHGEELGREVCRVLSTNLAPVTGPLKTVLDEVALPLREIPRAELEAMAKGPSYLAYNAKPMLAALDEGRSLLTEYSAPIAVWQFGDSLTLVGLPGETVSEYVTPLQTKLGHRKLWLAGYCNDCFGYLVTGKILAEGGYETRCLYSEPGFFAPEVDQVLIDAVEELAKEAGRKLGD